MRFRHKKTGGFYTLISLAVDEATLTPVVVYENDEGDKFVRTAAEFFDGRFHVMLVKGGGELP